MMSHKLILIVLVLLSSLVFTVGCKSGGAKPSNPFAQNRQTVPPPATFSSQESYLGQTPGNYVPQTPAATFPSSGSVLPTQPANIPLSGATNGNVSDQGATLFAAAEKETGWTPVEVALTSQTAFQAMETKVNSVSSNENGVLKTTTGMPESLIVGTSHVVTAITAESLPEATLSEPPLYSGKYAE